MWTLSSPRNFPLSGSRDLLPDSPPMNLYAILAVICHVGSRKLLLFKLLWDKSCRGVSLVTQELLLLMFLTRYLDLLYLFVNVVDELVKVWGTGRGLHGAWCEGIIWLPWGARQGVLQENCVFLHGCRHGPCVLRIGCMHPCTW